MSAFQRHYRNVHESDEIEKHKNRELDMNKQLIGPVRVEKTAQSQLEPRDQIDSTAKLIKLEQMNSQTTEAEKLETKPALIKELPKTGKFFYTIHFRSQIKVRLYKICPRNAIS